jgi:hypothetical protein
MACEARRPSSTLAGAVVDVLPIEDLMPALSARARSALAEADVVIGVDRASRREHTIYGIAGLDSSATFKKPSAMRVVHVSLDCDKASLESLLALVRRIKGA